MDKTTVAQYIDHTLLSPDLTEYKVIQACNDAIKYGFKSVCIPPAFVSIAKSKLYSKKPKITTVIGFPMGYNSTKIKIMEANQAFLDGVHEFDVVINISDLKSKKLLAVEKDLSDIINHFTGMDNLVFKAIIETGLLTEEEKISATKAAVNAGYDFVKTCTGINKGAATVEDVKLMLDSGAKAVKASGGIRTLEDLMSMVEAGATRIGTSNGISIINSLDLVSEEVRKDDSESRY
jgi:deoxyribose-phosphate aldolase